VNSFEGVKAQARRSGRGKGDPYASAKAILHVGSRRSGRDAESKSQGGDGNGSELHFGFGFGS